MPTDRGTPDLVRHCVAAVAKEYGGDTSRAFAICVASLQKAGYLKPGTMELTAAGKKKEAEHEAEPDAAKKLKAYEKLLKANRKEESVNRESRQWADEHQGDLKKVWKLTYGRDGYGWGGADDLEDALKKNGWAVHNTATRTVVASLRGDTVKFSGEPVDDQMQWDVEVLGFAESVKGYKFPFYAHNASEGMWFLATGQLKNGNYAGAILDGGAAGRSKNKAKKSSLDRRWASESWDEVTAEEVPSSIKAALAAVVEENESMYEAKKKSGGSKMNVKIGGKDVELMIWDEGDKYSVSVKTEDGIASRFIASGKTKSDAVNAAIAELEKKMKKVESFSYKQEAEWDASFYERLVRPSTSTGYEAYPRSIARRMESVSANESNLDFMRRLAGVTGRYEDRTIPSEIEVLAEEYKCLECGKKFKTAKAAEKAMNEGCPKCGGSDIDLAESRETLAEGTYDDKMGEFMDALKQDGWSVKTSHNLKPLKIPHATSPDGKTRLWFKARSVHYGPASSDIGDAHTLTYEDLKGYSVSAFMKLVAKAMGESVSEAAMRDPSGPIGRKIMDAIGNLRGDIEDTKRKLSDLEDAWEEHDWEYMKDAGYITAREFADMVAYEKSLSEE